jgi:hypothetical protein
MGDGSFKVGCYQDLDCVWIFRPQADDPLSMNNKFGLLGRVGDEVRNLKEFQDMKIGYLWLLLKTGTK